MKVIYLAGPLWSPNALGRALNIARAARAAWALWRQGHAVICPHLNSGPFALWGGAEHLCRWLSGDLAIIDRLDPSRGDTVYFLRNWHLSSGAVTEYTHALAAGLTIEFAPGAALAAVVDTVNQDTAAEPDSHPAAESRCLGVSVVSPQHPFSDVPVIHPET
jgi:hypothetical protein